jgi:hypothetical protein
MVSWPADYTGSGLAQNQPIVIPRPAQGINPFISADIAKPFLRTLDPPLVGDRAADIGAGVDGGRTGEQGEGLRRAAVIAQRAQHGIDITLLCGSSWLSDTLRR